MSMQLNVYAHMYITPVSVHCKWDPRCLEAVSTPGTQSSRHHSPDFLPKINHGSREQRIPGLGQQGLKASYTVRKCQRNDRATSQGHESPEGALAGQTWDNSDTGQGGGVINY